MKINEQLFKYFENVGHKVYYHPQQIIYLQEDNSKSLYLIISGRVRVYNIFSNGEESTIEILERGSIFGESSFFQNISRPISVSAVDEVELIACQLDELYPYLTQSQELTIALLQHLSQRCDHVTSLLKKAYTYNRYEKMAAFLLEAPHKKVPYTLSYTHEELASLVGLSRVTISKVLKEFENKGMIKNKYRKIVVVNPTLLKDILKNK